MKSSSSSSSSSDTASGMKFCSNFMIYKIFFLASSVAKSSSSSSSAKSSAAKSEDAKAEDKDVQDALDASRRASIIASSNIHPSDGDDEGNLFSPSVCVCCFKYVILYSRWITRFCKLKIKLVNGFESISSIFRFKSFLTYCRP